MSRKLDVLNGSALLVALGVACGCTEPAPEFRNKAAAALSPSVDSRVPLGAVRAEVPDWAAILEAVIRDIVSKPDSAALRSFYGSPGDDRIALVTDSTVPWPADFQPNVSGVRFLRCREPVSQDWDEPRLPGLRLDKFDLNESPDILSWKSHIRIVMLNVGGHGDEAIRTGGHAFYYNVKRAEDGFEIVFAGSES